MNIENQRARMEYLDFELDVSESEGKGGGYIARVLHSPAGQGRETLLLPEGWSPVGLDLAQIHTPAGVPPSFSKVLGRALYNMLLVGEVRTKYEVSKAHARNQSKGLRLKLRLAPGRLAALPWEFLYDEIEGDFVALRLETPLVRYVEIPRQDALLEIEPPLRLLCMAAAPSNLPPLNVAAERARLEQAVYDLRAHGLLHLAWVDGQSYTDLAAALNAGSWHALHFIGHARYHSGLAAGQIALADSQGLADPINADDFARLLCERTDLRLVFLNACDGARTGDYPFSGLASALLRQGLPAVLAMQAPITDAAAIELAQTFYQAVAQGWRVDVAVALARQAVKRATPLTAEWGVPVLSMHAPDGVLFRFPLHSAFPTTPALPAADLPPAVVEDAIAPLALIQRLAALIRQRRQQGRPPYRLLLGVGAAFRLDDEAFIHIVDHTLQTFAVAPPPGAAPVERLDRFYRLLGDLSLPERSAVLASYLENLPPSTGLRHLAALAKDGCLPFIWTTALDATLEQVLAESGASLQDVHVLVNGRDPVTSFRLPGGAAPITLWKLYGDLRSQAYACLPVERGRYLRALAPQLEAATGDMLVVGCDPRDDLLLACLSGAGSDIWFGGDGDDPRDLAERVHWIRGPAGCSDHLFAWLRLALELPQLDAASDDERAALQAFTIACQADAGPDLLTTLEQLARIYDHQGNVLLAELCYDRALALTISLGRTELQVTLTIALANLHSRLNRPREARRVYDEAAKTGLLIDPVLKAIYNMGVGRWYWLARKSGRQRGLPAIRRSAVQAAVDLWQSSLEAMQVAARPEAALLESWLLEARTLLDTLDAEKNARPFIRLTVIGGPLDGDAHEQPAFDVLHIGRSRACEFTFDAKGISERHARLRYADGAVWLEDAGSAAGTFLAGALAPLTAPVRLRNGDVFALGPRTQVQFTTRPMTVQESQIYEMSDYMGERMQALARVDPERAADLHRRLTAFAGAPASVAVLQAYHDCLQELMAALPGEQGELPAEIEDMRHISTFAQTYLSSLLSSAGRTTP